MIAPSLLLHHFTIEPLSLSHTCSTFFFSSGGILVLMRWLITTWVPFVAQLACLFSRLVSLLSSRLSVSLCLFKHRPLTAPRRYVIQWRIAAPACLCREFFLLLLLLFSRETHPCHVAFSTIVSLFCFSIGNWKVSEFSQFFRKKKEFIGIHLLLLLACES